MSCLSNCRDCSCEGLDICSSTDKKQEKLNEKLKVLKDYSCFLGRTTCVNLAKKVGEYSFFLWCYLKDLTELSLNLERRVDALCVTIKCEDNRINRIIGYLNSQLQNDVQFSMKSGGSSEGTGSTNTYTKIDTTPDGGFTINWNMVDTRYGEVGKGTITGVVNHSYNQEQDGSIKASIKSFTLKNATYNLTGGRTDETRGASFYIRDSNGGVVWRKDYHPRSSWSESINKTVNLDKTVTLQPKGGTSGDIPILNTYDNWVLSNTVGHVSANYVNNNSSNIFASESCPINCTACEHKGV